MIRREGDNVNSKQRRKKNTKTKKEENLNVEKEIQKTGISPEEVESHQEENILDDEITDVDFGTPIMDPKTFLGGIFYPMLKGGYIDMMNAQQQNNPVMMNPLYAYAQQQMAAAQQPQTNPATPAQPQQQMAAAQQAHQPQPNPAIPAHPQQFPTGPTNPEQQTLAASSFLTANPSVSAAATSIPMDQQNFLKAQGVAEFKANFMSAVSPEKQEIVNLILQEAVTHKPVISDEQAEEALERIKDSEDDDDDSLSWKDAALYGGGAALLLAGAWFGYNYITKHGANDDVIGDVVDSGSEFIDTLSKYVEF